MKTLLTTINAKYIHTNLAIRLLYELNHEKEGLDWKEFALKEDRQTVADHCSKYDVVAFSCYIWNITATLQVATMIKAINPSSKILLGGPEVSFEWEPIIALPSIDYIIVGEGEISFNAFLNNFPQPEQVPGLVWKKDGDAVQNPMPPMFDLNGLQTSLPYKNDPPSDLAHKVLYIETSRGCPYKCEFCLASLDNKVRQLPMESIKNNLLFLMEQGRVIKFLDRTFNIKKEFTLEIFKFILANHKPGNVFQFEITADIMHPDIIAFINASVPKGLFRFEIGIQTINQTANLEVSRKQNFDKTKQIIQSIQGNVEMHLDLIVGLPLDYWSDVKHSIEEVFKLFAPELQLGFLKFLKGTPLRDKSNQHDFRYDAQPPYQIIQSKYLSKEELDRLVKLEHALEIYWNSGKAINTLKYIATYYNSFDFLLGFGEHFGTKRDYHAYGLKDVFEIALDYASLYFPDDKIIKELIDIDYHLFHKVKPKALYLKEVDKSTKNQWVEQLNLNHHKFRFGIYPLSFDYVQFTKTLQIFPAFQPLVLRYSGTAKAVVIASAHATSEG